MKVELPLGDGFSMEVPALYVQKKQPASKHGAVINVLKVS